MEIFKHFARTLLIVVGLAALVSGLLYVMILLKVNASVIVVTPIVLGLAYAYFSARWHPYWAPISKQAMRLPWTQADGTAMETCIEIAQLQVGHSVSSVYRASIYQSANRKRIQRCLIGDSVTLLGAFEPGVWFYIHDRFYARRDGLVCLDTRTCQWRFHQPKSVIELDDNVRKKERRGVVSVIWNGVPQQINLQQLPVEQSSG